MTTIRLNKKVFGEFDNFCDCNYLNKTKVLNIIITRFLEDDPVSYLYFINESAKTGEREGENHGN